MNATARTHPFDALFDAAAERAFPAIRDGLDDESRDPRDRDAFLLSQPVVELLKELRPEEGLGSRMAEFQALVHHGYLYWADGGRTIVLTRADTEALLATEVDRAVVREYRGAHYAQFPPRFLWAQLADDAPFEPLDGCFIAPMDGEYVAVLGVFGFHPERAALTVAEAIGPPPAPPTRTDGSPAFAPVMAGGERAGLHSLVTTDELLYLGAATIPAFMSRSAS